MNPLTQRALRMLGRAVTILLAIGLCLGALAWPPEPARAWPGDLGVGWTSPDFDSSYAVALGDYDSDGDLDFALGNYSTTEESKIFRNDGNGVFTQVWTAPNPAWTTALAWGDYDNDGDLDLAVGNQAPFFNQVFRNNGGVFSQAWADTTTLATSDLEWVDYDADGLIDLAVGISGQGPLVYKNWNPTYLWSPPNWYRGMPYGGTGSDAIAFVSYPSCADSYPDIAIGDANGQVHIFCHLYNATYGNHSWQHVWSSNETMSTYSLAWGDWDNDGDLDLLAGADGISRVYEPALSNYGAVWSSESAQHTRAAAWSDWDQDGDLDVLMANDQGEQLRIYNNNTVETPSVADAGRLTLDWTSPEVYRAFALDVGDLDGDTDPDLLISTPSSSIIYYNNNLPITPGWSSAGANTTLDLAWGDWDNDGDLDLAVANRDEPNLVYQNNGGELSLAWTDPSPNFSFGAAWGDYDGDGYLDLAVANWGLPSRVYHNTGGELEPAWSSPTTLDATCVSWADVDGDGDLDLLLGTRYQGTRLYINTDGEFTLTWTSTENWYNVSLDWSDYDQDGDLDLAVGNVSTGRGFIYRNDAGVFSVAWSTPDGDSGPLAWGDWDLDGDLDLAVGYINLYAKIYASSGGATPTFTEAWTSPFGWQYTNEIDWADWDGDGDLDLAFGNSFNRSHIFLNHTAENPAVADSERLHWGWSTQSGADTSAIAIGDVDNDGDPDLATGNYATASQIYLNGGNRMALDLSTGERSAGSAVAWGDYDGDNDLDLAVGNGDFWNGAKISRIYRNDNGELIQVFSTPARQTSSLAWGDVDGDGDLDLALGNFVSANEVYRNNGGGNFTPYWSAAWTFEATSGVAWGDYDSDGDLDLAAAMGNAANSGIYRNTGTNLTTALEWTAPDTSGSVAVAWSDIDLDGDLDLAFASKTGAHKIFLNDNGSFSLFQSLPSTGTATGLAWGDYDGDGDPDLAVANSGAASVLYRNDAGMLVFDQMISTVASTLAIAWSDWDNDGDLDLSLGDGLDRTLHYENDAGSFTLAWTPDERRDVRSLAWADYDQDGDEDMVVATENLPARVYQNRTSDSIAQGDLVTARVAYPGGGAAQFYSSALVLEGPTININYTLYDDQSDAARFVEAFYSIDNGSTWEPALASTGTTTTNLAASPTGTQHTYGWDVYGSGFFGRSDQVVFRLDVYQGFTNPGPYQFALTTARSMPFRVRGMQVRVMNGGAPVSGALVYRLPAGETGDFQPYQDLAGNAYTTDVLGYLRGRGTLEIGDQLVALYPYATTDSYGLYYTSAAPTTNGINPDTVTTPGPQILTVSSGNPLLLFNLDVSLEWDARTDSDYLIRLEADIERASEFLYDWTNGQVAMGRVTIYHAREHWNDADVQIYASNHMRPNASQGGITTAALPDPQGVITYYPGQVHMGATWNRYGEQGSLAEDWPRTLAHELGHYALYLDDNYLGRQDGSFTSLDPAVCPSAMSDPYRQASPFDELHPDGDWLPGCAPTLSNQATGRSDWDTLTHFYPALAAYQPASGVIDGPADLVVDVTQVSFVEPTAPPTALADPTFYLTLNGASYRPGDRAHAYLFSGDWVTDLGRPSLDTVIARGVSAGDEVCLIEADQSLVGCTTVTPPLQELALFTAENWQPQVLLTPASTSITVSVSNLPPGLSLSTRLYPVGAAAGPAVDLSWNGSVYQASIPTTQAAVAGTVRVWVNEAAPQRVTVANFSLGGNPARQHIGSNVLMRGRFAPAVSADGQVILFGDIQFTGDQFYAIQTAAAVPQAPSYATLVGESYYLLTSVDAPSLAGTTLSISYMARDVPDGEEIWLKMYYWNGSQWILLPSELDTDENMVTAPCQGQGLYALMSSVEIPLEAGWNLFSYPIPVSRTVTETLSSIAGSYSVVYNYNAATADWTVYGVDAPDWVNDLELFQFSKGYYINTTQATTLYLKGGFGPQGQNAPTLGVPYPPATYYGQVLSSAYFTPSAGQTVTVRIGEQVCGQGLTQNVGGQIVYVVNVAAAVQTAGCGVPGAGISFQVGAQAMAQAPLWNNNNLWELNLSPNAAPNPTPDTASTPEETTANLTVLANDTDPDGDSLSLQSVTSPAHGIAVINGTTVQYTPQLNYNGADTFYYTAVDVYGQTATALVSVQVTPVNDLPTAVDDTASVTEDVPSNIPVLNNDDDIDGDSISIHSVGAPLHGSATISGSVIQYTPASGYSGPDVFTYTIADPSGLMDTASVTVQVVEGVNAGPLAVADVALTLEDNAVTIPSLANDSDPNGDALTITGVEPPLHGTAVISGSGSLAVIIYTPELNFNGLDAFMYTISDGLLSANAMVRVTVQPVNDPPQAEAGADLTAVEGQELSFSGSYVDPDETSGAIISWDFGDGGSDESTLSPTHTYANEGVYTVTLTVTDTAGASASDSLQVTVANVAPQLNPIADQVIQQGEALAINGVIVDPGLLDAHPVTIEWEAGVTETLILEPGVLSFVFTHTFTVAGSYPVTITVSDGLDFTSTAFTVEVEPLGESDYHIWLPLIINSPSAR